MKKFVGVCISAVAIIGLSSCGGGGMGSDGVKELTDALVKSAAESDTTIDQACVVEVVKELSEDDLKLLVDNLDALVEGSVDISTLDISEEGFATFITISDCITE
jgi:hypothetical protein